MDLTSSRAVEDYRNWVRIVHQVTVLGRYLISDFEKFLHLSLHRSAKTLQLGYVPIDSPSVEIRLLVPKGAGYVFPSVFSDGVEKSLKDILVRLFACPF
jgi:hypothetical protein